MSQNIKIEFLDFWITLNNDINSWFLYFISMYIVCGLKNCVILKALQIIFEILGLVETWSKP